MDSASTVAIFRQGAQGYETVCYNQTCPVSPNRVARELHETIREVKQFFNLYFQQNGLDGRGKIVPLVIGWDKKNARWECQSGNCLLRFNDFYTRFPEVVAHEFMHGVIQHLNPLIYNRQSGALNESICDAMGVTFNYFRTGRLNWKIGDLRDLSDHTTAANYVNTNGDAGGVHTNSAIPNHAFYAAVVKTDSIIKVARVWFTAFQQVSHTATFKEFAKRTVEVAKAYGISFEVLSAWEHVGVLKSQTKVENTFFGSRSVLYYS